MIPFQILGLALLMIFLSMAAIRAVVRKSSRKDADWRRQRGLEVSDTARCIADDFEASQFPYRVSVSERGHRGALIAIHAEGLEVCPMRVRARAVRLMNTHGWGNSDLPGHWEIVCFGGVPIERPPACQNKGSDTWGGFAFSLEGSR